MPITQGFVQLPDDSGNTGKKEDHVITDNGNYREVISIGGPEVDAQLAPVSATNGLAVDPKTLPPGASTSAKQDTGNNSLAAIDLNAGATTDAAVVGDNAGTISAKLRGLNKILNDVWDSVNHWLKVQASNFPTTVDTNSGNKSSSTLRVVLATDQPALTNAQPVSIPALAVSAAVTSVNDTNTSVQLLASTSTRKGYKLFNDSTQIAYVKEGTTASTSDYSYQLPANGYYESVGVGIYTGRIDAIWAADGSGAMKITELS